jgi:3',5'-cyclic AMP phosphodiesterase CpdA
MRPSNPIRLLHISDIHFGIENPSALAAASGFVAETPFDLLVISGDFTQSGHHAEFRSASAWLAGLLGPRLMTPGNHDTPWMGLVERAVAPFSRYARAIGPASSATFDGPGLSVHALNSARGWQIRLNWSKGQVSHRQARAAVRRLQVAPRDSVRVVVCHHPLVEVEGGPMTGRVRGGAAAAEHFAEGQIDLILTGHIHAPFVQALPYGDGRTYAVGAGTLSLRERDAPPGFNVIEIADDRMKVRAMAWTGQALEVSHNWEVGLRPRTGPQASSEG